MKTKISLPKKINKGTPPKIENASNNLAQIMEDDLVAFNFRVPAEFRKKVKQFALDNNTTAVCVMTNAIQEYMNK